jgi:hypothetical protein
MPKYSRRDLGLLIPPLATVAAAAQTRSQISKTTPADNSLEKLPRLRTHAYIFNELPETTNGKNKERRLFTGKTMRLDPGDVGSIGSNEIHNAKNVDTDRAQYFILNIGRDDV